MFAIAVNDFEDWRGKVRGLIARGVRPEEVVFSEAGEGQGEMFGMDAPANEEKRVKVPREFVRIAEAVACHRDSERWGILYRVMYRLTRGGEKNLLKVSVDDDVRRLAVMEKQVRFDAHKMKAFVRFRKVEDGEGGERYIAWHESEHRVLRRVSPFFSRRFAVMKWSVMTPWECAHWDGGELSFSEGMPRRCAPSDDELEELWKTYYRSIFNPARIKLKAMRKEMPKRYWGTMPETELIPQLLREAPRRVELMVKNATARVAGAEAFLPKGERTMENLRNAARTCQGCELHCRATQTVFGEGPADAIAMFVAEQPGDNEDRVGRPFVGPAGEVFDAALKRAGIVRESAYVTSAVKHFKWEPRGERRIHTKPSAREIQACRPWLWEELKIVRPRVLVLLGNTAGQSLIGPTFKITRDRGKVFESEWAKWTIATFHPSALLRVPDENVRRTFQAAFDEDLGKVAAEMRRLEETVV